MHDSWKGVDFFDSILGDEDGPADVDPSASEYAIRFQGEGHAGSQYEVAAHRGHAPYGSVTINARDVLTGESALTEGI